ncbi:Prokaryotic metallothionein [Salinispora arenicola]|uniref:Prokaryotic metallothionein n=1 Tax=Salinispora arenicola TaxID=168697 RepID=UPI0016914F58|nr:Prokaryotic metallothionein [Salinispora arenicola]NIL57569.1 Prokaryotic metallothionein [Salinispora arenicola]NIL63445.1 Prokaryotic metallothionein [Salinispora arenicola]
MASCDVCGNEYKFPFQVHTANGDVHTFDSFECATHMLAPTCEHCQVKAVGHGVEVSGHFYCCAHCARSARGDREGAQPRDTVGARSA